MGWTDNFLPLYPLLNQLLEYGSSPAWKPRWVPVFWSIIQTAGLWLLASRIFARRDIAATVE